MNVAEGNSTFPFQLLSSRDEVKFVVRYSLETFEGNRCQLVEQLFQFMKKGKMNWNNCSTN
jgi:hypothetical protein